MLYERWCENGAFRSELIPCPQGEFCQNGACAAGQPLPATCSDSDNGRNIHVLGTVTGRFPSGVSFTYRDNCADSGTGLYERWCENGAFRSDFIPCPQGEFCQNGTCVTGSLCFTNDPFHVPTLLGTVTDHNGRQQPDICEDDDTVIQFACNPNGEAGVHSQVSCDRGCHDGVCM